MNSTQFDTAVAYSSTCMIIALNIIGIILALISVVGIVIGLAYFYTAWKQARGK